MKKTNKSLALVLALAMVLTLFAGIAQASTTPVLMGSAPVTVIPAAQITPGQIVIANLAQTAVAVGTTTEVRVTLPAGATWVADPIVTQVVTAGGTANVAGLARADDNRTAIFTVANASTTDAISSIRFNGGAIEVGTAFRGALEATVVATNTRTVEGVTFTNWTQTATAVRLFNVVAPGTTTTVLEAPFVAIRGAANQPARNIRIVETITGTLIAGNITLTAPAGVTFAAAPTVGVTGTNADAVALTAGQTFPSRTAVYTVTPVTGAASTVTFSAILLNVDLTAATGPINIEVSGAGVTTAAVAPASIGAGAVAAARIDVNATPVTAGLLNQAVSGIMLTANAPGAFLPNRLVTFTLPTGYTWFAAGTPAWASAPTVSADGRVLTYWTLTPSGSEFNLTGLAINAHITAAAGDVIVTVGGNAGAIGTAVVATNRRPVTLTAVTAPNVRVDSPRQALGNLVIAEGFAGALRVGDIVLTLPVGLSLEAAPTVAATVASGSAPTFGTIAFTARTVTIPVATVSTQPATVTISGLRVTTDRGVPFGPVTVQLTGSAILDPAATAGLAGTTPATVDAARGTVAGEAVLANVISRTASSSVFTIDSTTFTVDGVAHTLEVAPRVVEGRTLLPLRAAANAVGVSNADIDFFPETGTIILFRGDRIAQLRLGSNIILVNGIPMTMEVAPQVVNGRTLIPVRWIARALGVAVAWDAAAQTVTVSVP